MKRDNTASGRECRRVRELLSERLDRPLQPDETRRLTVHLPGCPGCMQFERTLGRGMHAITALPAGSADPAVREAVLRRAAGSKRRALLGQGLKLAGAATTFVLIGLLLVTVLRSNGDGDGTSDRLGSGSGVEATATTEVLPTPPATQPALAQACATSLVSTIDQAMTISSTPNGAIIWFGVQGDPVDCVVPTSAVVTLADRDGTPLAIEGNGLSVDLVPGGDVKPTIGSVLWLNWCGERDVPFMLSIAFDGGTINSEFDGAPGCDDPQQPSKLAVAPPNEIAPDWPSADLACADDQFSWNVDTLSSDGSRLMTLKASPSSAPCLLEGEFVVTLLDARQQPLDITGNGFTLQVAGLVPIPGDVYSLFWTNWCGETSDISLTIESESSASGMGPIDPPECRDPNRPSVLELIPDPDPTEAEATAELAACPPDQLTYALSSEGAAGTRYITVSVTGPATAQCAISEKFNVEITDPNGEPLDIDGNNLIAAIDAPWPAVADVWVAWTNWCGEAGSFQVLVDAPNGGLSLEIDSPPCVNPEAPSELLLGDHRFR